MADSAVCRLGESAGMLFLAAICCTKASRSMYGSTAARTDRSAGVWSSNTKTRRGKLTQEQLDALRELGVDSA
ncbi:helicase associated domain-containing protein (plasmid) [Streptomyces sp. NBC_01351]|uniref:helicase associated domain-containing protein n=1 Tax=Streptomyces sp. NBC_01351 TaxID=2903833 RepID=UPI002E33BF4C|nr:helicase associated domain-containing protein [Streptomyces sp. NBC_01351]